MKWTKSERTRAMEVSWSEEVLVVIGEAGGVYVRL